MLTGSLIVTGTADNTLWIYDDYGVILNVNDWQFTDNVRLSTDVCLLAMKAQDYGVDRGLIASTNTGVVTDSTWKCSGSQPTDDSWMSDASFDDSDWNSAVIVPSNIHLPTIWHSSTSCSTAYCRKILPV